MLPFELVATATDSPRDSPGGSLRKFDTVVNGISGTPVIVAFACANAGPAAGGGGRDGPCGSQNSYHRTPPLRAGSVYQLEPSFNGSSGWNSASAETGAFF